MFPGFGKKRVDLELVDLRFRPVELALNGNLATVVTRAYEVETEIRTRKPFSFFPVRARLDSAELLGLNRICREPDLDQSFKGCALCALVKGRFAVGIEQAVQT